MLPYLIFNGKDSRGVFQVLEKTDSILNKEVTTQVVSKQDGVKVTNVRHNAKIFKIKILFTPELISNNSITNVRDLKRTIAHFFNSDEEKQFWYSKDHGAYQMAIYQGSSEIEFLGDNTCIAELEFLNPQGIDFNVDESTYTSDTNIYEIDYAGTYRTYPKFEVEVNEENGLIGIVNLTDQDNPKIIQIGSIEEDDTVIKDKGSKFVVADIAMSQENLDNATWKFNTETGYEVFDKIPFNSINTQKFIQYKVNRKNMKYPIGTVANLVTFLHTKSTTKQFSGVSFRRDITKIGNIDGAINFDFFFSPLFISNNIKETGLVMAELLDINGKNWCSIIFEKNSTTQNVGSFRIYKKGILMKEIGFRTNENYGNMKEILVRKVRDQFEVHTIFGTFVFVDKKMGSEQIKTIRISIGQYGQNAMLQDLGIENIRFMKHNVQFIEDVPNTFSNGDRVVIDTEEKKVYVNGLERSGLADIGSQWDDFYLKPLAKNKFNIVNSVWASEKALNTKITATEKYL